MSDPEVHTPNEPTPLVRPRFRIHTKVLSLVVVAALLPALLIATTSFLTARRILIEKAHAELSVRRDAALSILQRWQQERDSEAGHFAQADIVVRGLTDQDLPGPASGAEDPDSIHDYLEKIQEREPLYGDLAVLDRRGRSLARLRPGDPAPSDGAERLLLRSDGTSEAVLHRAILGPDETEIGRFVAARNTVDLWAALDGDFAHPWGKLTITTSESQQVYPEVAAGEAGLPIDEPCGKTLDAAGVTSFRGTDGGPLLAAFAPEPGLGLCVRFAVDEAQALAAVNELGRQTAVIVLVGALLLAALGYVLAHGLLRPVRALIDGAQAVEEGDLEHVVEVRSEDEIGYLTQVFNHMTASLRRSYARLERLSTLDELTGLLNRRELNRRFRETLARVQVQGRPLAILMLDVDHFKAINDRFGHRRGDEVLIELARLLDDVFESPREIGRWGGEEFVALLPGRDAAAAVDEAELLRGRIEAAALGVDDGAPLTVSVGIATLPEHGEEEDDLLQAADEALYLAKRLGRNRVELAAAPTRSAAPGSSR